MLLDHSDSKILFISFKVIFQRALESPSIWRLFETKITKLTDLFCGNRHLFSVKTG